MLTVTVPNPAAAGSIGQIAFYNKDTDLWRCGRAVQRNGSLDFSHQADDILVENAILVVPSGFRGPRVP